ncbi:uncharacterized protein LOC116617788 isoform X2 [Nematostella vectensis]|uniref:uncharacterized protein LOC116617788 isoform X2 n=1 Tax=Nematostella vectensis TaxID=45351 RepID=UPI002077297F|nr:uncharacterized protein LOC116617788 isoform X2 [Nematostella vectensis]
MFLGFLFFFAWIGLKGANCEYLEACKKTKIEENVTLRGGIGAGTFRKLAKVTSMASCIELCCKTSSCDVAFLSNMKCYGVECVSDAECESTTTDTSDTKVLIAHVRTGKKKEGKSPLALAGIPTHNTPTFKQAAKAPLINTLGINPQAKGIIPGHPPNMGPASGRTAGMTTVAPKAQVDNHPANISPGLAGQCKAGKMHFQVTLKGGIKAGTYKDVGAVADMRECADRCCGYAQCDLAFLLRSRCYLVGCSDVKSCDLQKAKPSPYNPAIAYVSRWNSEGVKHTINVKDDVNSNYKCSPMKLMSKVTLKGGLKAGDFTDTGKANNIGECYDLCCQQPTCNLAFMLGQNCFSVKCYTKDLCSTIPAQPSIYNPQIAYVWNRKMTPHKDKPEQAPSTKSAIPKPAPSCPNTKIEEQVTLVGGLNAGSFHDNGKVTDMTQCRRICCEKPMCNLAFMLGVSCFTVICKNVALCKTMPAKPSQFSPKISFVRPFGSNDFIGSPTAKSSTPPVPPASLSTISTTPQPITTSAPQPITTSAAQPITTLAAGPDVTGMASPAVPGPQAGLPDLPGLGEPHGPGNGQPPLEAFGQPLLPPQPSSPFNPMQSTTTHPPLPNHVTEAQQAMAPGLPAPDKHPQSAMPALQTGQQSAMPALQTGQQSAMPALQAGLEAMMSDSSIPDKPITANKPLKIPKPEEKPEVNLGSTITKARPGQAMKMNIVDGKLQLTPVDTAANETEADKSKPKKPSGAFDAIFGEPEKPQNFQAIPKAPANLRCRPSNITNDKVLAGGMGKKNFTIIHDVEDMGECMTKCCHDNKCDIAYYVDSTCYAVTCSTKAACRPVSGKGRGKVPLLSAMLMKPKEPEDDVIGGFDIGEGGEEKSSASEEVTNLQQYEPHHACTGSRISSGVSLRGNRPGNFTSMGNVDNIKMCIALCCTRPRCDIAYMENNKCFAVHCNDGVQCQTAAHQADDNTNVKFAYMDRHQAQPVKERDWMIVYIIAGSLAFAAGLGGVIWAACVCTKRNKIIKQRRLLEDEEDEDDEMLPKPTSTRYRTPMHRY